MPNWCETKYVFIGDKKEMKDLYDLMKGLESLPEPLVPNDFGTTWLGCLVTKLGGDWNEISCRGKWMDLTLNENDLRFETSTAWGPCDAVMELICDKFPSLSYFYQAIEWGNEVFETNDYEGEFFPEIFALNYDSETYGSGDGFFESEKDLFEYLTKQFERPINSFEDIETLNQDLEKEDGYCTVFDFEYN